MVTPVREGERQAPVVVERGNRAGWRGRAWTGPEPGLSPGDVGGDGRACLDKGQVKMTAAAAGTVSGGGMAC